MKRGSCVVNGREGAECDEKMAGGEVDMFKVDYSVYLHLLLYTRSPGAYRGVMKLSGRHSKKIVLCGFHVPL
jgi:hypothetical protein